MKPARLFALDAFRGITVALMILVNNPNGLPYPTIFQHARWHGCTLADLVFPFFLFIVGVAMPYSFARRFTRGDDRKKVLLHVICRTLLLFGLGLLANAFASFDLETFRVMGALQRIALCYFFASLIFLAFKMKGVISFAVFLPAFYWFLMRFVPVPGYGPGILEREGNLAQYIDSILLGRHVWKWTGTWDPEGVLSTMPAIATTLIGMLAGEHLQSNRSPLRKTVSLFLSGAFCLAIGALWNPWFPINKSLWTSSYVAFTGGIALVCLAGCYYVIDIKNHGLWAKPFTILGRNALIVYVLSEIVASILDKASIQRNGFIYLALWLAVAAVLYRQRIFVKV